MVATLELCARTEDALRYKAPFFGNYNLDSLYGYDQLGRYGLPDATYMKWHLNSAGYRGPGFRQGTYRIVCLGSSETFGLYESPENEWPRRLEARLNPGGAENFEVINASYPGMTIETHLRRLPRMLKAVHPQMAVIYPSYTSYIGIDKPLSWPQKEVDAGPLYPQNHFEWRIEGKLQVFLKEYLPAGLQHRLRSSGIAMDTHGRPVASRLPEQNVEAFRTDMLRLVTELRAHGVKVVLVTHATRFGPGPSPVDPELLVEWRVFYPTLTEAGLLDMERRMSQALRDVGATENVPVIDAAEKIAPGGINFAEFVHFTDAGADALAKLVAEEVRREKLAELSPRPMGSPAALP